MNTVDVVIPLHDVSRPIRRCIRSVLANEDVDVRVLVVAHNLPAEAVRARLGEWADDGRVSVHELCDRQQGPSSPKNYGLDLAEASFVSLVDSDDELQAGTLDRWVQIAEDEHADFVIANRREPHGSDAPSPPVRPGRRRDLDGVKDRLAYRAAPLGLIRRSRFGHLRFPLGLPTGEDIPFSAQMWFGGARIAFAFGQPGYVVHDDQAERATTTARPVRETLLWLDDVLDPEHPWMQDPDQRLALLVRLLRHNLPDAAATRIPGGWGDVAKREMRAALLQIRRADPRALDYMSEADWKLLTALVSGHASESEVSRLLEARRNLRSLDALTPHRPSLLFSQQGPLRTHLAGAALAHSRPTAAAQGASEEEPARSAFPAGRMIFHAPFPVEDGATSASGIRPWKMLQAFRNLGYEVLVITGYAKERRAQFAALKRRFRQGWHPDFCYSEAATIPSSFTEPKHFPLVLNLDRDVFRFLHDRDIPIGVFYRDVYWAFPDYVAQVGNPVAVAMRHLYRREIATLNKYATTVFLPTEQMAAFVPGLKVPAVALPPGSDAGVASHTATGDSSAAEPLSEARNKRAGGEPAAKSNPLALLYLGDIGGEHYDVSALLEAVRDTPGVTLKICTRPSSWEAAQEQYRDLLCDRVQVKHESGAGLEPLYEDADVACLVMRPREYRSFAAPMKLYEYFGHGKPVLASAQTHAAEVVESEAAGWVVDFRCTAIAQQLRQLRDNPQEVAEKASNARAAGVANTWAERAQFAATTLMQGSAPGTSQDLHVLVLPSWYPQDSDDAHGSFFREQAEAMAASGINVGVLALEENPVYTKGRPRTAIPTATEEDGLHVVRAPVPRIIPFQRLINVKLAGRALERAWETYTSRYGVPDVLHAHSLYPGAFFARELSRKHGIPFVYTEHRTLGHMPSRSVASQNVERGVAGAAASRHAVSRGHAQHLSERFQGTEWDYTPNLLPNVVKRPGRSRGARTGSTAGDYVYGHLSVLDPVKRIERLIAAFAEVHKQDLATSLVIGGSGEGREGLQQQVKDLGLEGSVTFLGQLSRDEVNDFYDSIDAFVLPSFTEPMGVVQIEALASGVPVISTRTWGGETVIEEGDGLLVDIDDHQQLVEAMNRIRDWDEDDQTRLARRTRAIDRFGRSAFVGRYREIYRRAVQGVK